MPSAPRAGAATLLFVVGAAVLGACGEENGRESPAQPAATTTAPLASSTGPASTVSGSASPAPTARTLEFVVRGTSVEGPSRQRVSLNERVRLRVTSDVAEEVHVHGYERRAPVTPGAVAEIEFVADIPGVFEVELEKAHRRLVVLEVQP